MEEIRFAEASEWFGRLREESLSPEAIAEWLKWCDADPRNLSAYRGVQEIWGLAGDAGVVDWPQREESWKDRYEGEMPVAQWQKITQELRNRRQPWQVPRLAAAIGLLACGLGAWGTYEALKDPGMPYTTRRGTQRQLQLPDGSAVALGAASQVRVAFDAEWRQVRLEKGEAYFKVARDLARPFVVRTDRLEVTALGTAFTVRADDRRTVVVVTEGRVQIAPLKSILLHSRVVQPVQAQAGQQIAFDERATQPLIRPADAATALGWQDGALTYVDEPLRAVVTRINRYSPRNVELGDPALGELRFTGTVFENQIEEWARGLERVFPLRVAREDDGSLKLETRR